MVFKITVDPEKCIGCQACTSCSNFQMNEETGKAYPVSAEVEDVGCNEEAKGICPTEAIIIEED